MIADQRGSHLRDLLDSDGDRSYWTGTDDDGGQWWFQTVADEHHRNITVRQLEIGADGARHRYDVWHLQDDHGFLTDQPIASDRAGLQPCDRGSFHRAWSDGAPILHVQNEAGENYDDPSEDLLFDLLAELGPGNAFLIVDRLDTPAEGHHYVQVLRLDDGRFLVEHREGDPATHRHATVDDRRTAHRVITAWAFDLPGWRHQVPWAPLTPTWPSTPPRPANRPRQGRRTGRS